MLKLPRSTFYYEQKLAARKARDADLLRDIEIILLEFTYYGYRSVTKALRRMNHVVSRKTVQRIMQENKLQCRKRKSFAVQTTDSNHAYPIYPNLLEHFRVERLDHVWVADITYIRIDRGFVYLAVILDLCSRRAIGYALSTRIDKQLSLSALQMAIENRKPQPGCIHHSDRGSPYAAHDYIDLLKANGFQISMSRKGNPYDNAVAESFMKTLKYNNVYLSDYRTWHDVLENVFQFIEDVYNAKRLHSSLGYVPPNEFEANLTKGGEAQATQLPLPLLA